MKLSIFGMLLEVGYTPTPDGPEIIEAYNEDGEDVWAILDDKAKELMEGELERVLKEEDEDRSLEQQIEAREDRFERDFNRYLGS